MKDRCKVIILAGGQGTRFWPVSRIKRPKQFLSISDDGESLIQATARRIKDLDDKPWVVTNQLHKELISEHVPNSHIICEPVGRNTAASIGLAAIHLSRQNEKAVMLVLPADHAVADEKQLLLTLSSAIKVAAEQSKLVTIGIAPLTPHTGYGYIKRGASCAADTYEVSRFFEKPNFERAVKYLESGEFYWNSGMFAWRVDVILEAFKQHLPALYDGLMTIRNAIGSENEAQVLAKVFPDLESISIDFGILEHAKNCAVVEGKPFGWNDVGSWDAWAEHFGKDANGNLRHGDVMVIDSKNCVVHSQHRLTAVIGAEDLIVIDTGDALLVCPRDHVQDVRKVVEELKRCGRQDLV